MARHRRGDRRGLTGRGDLEPLLDWLVDYGHRDLTLHDIAARPRVSERTLSRRFREETSHSPLQWLDRHRVRRAQEPARPSSPSLVAARPALVLPCDG